MTATPSPAPGERKPWRKSEAPDHKPKHAPKSKEGAGEKVVKVLKGTRDAVSRASGAVEKVKVKDLTDKVSGAVSSARTNHKRKIWAAIGLVAALGAAKLGTTGYDAVQDYQRTTDTQRTNEIPQEHIVIPVTIRASAKSGNIRITPKSGTKIDQCGQEHKIEDVTVSGEAMRKDRVRASQTSVKFTVNDAHGKTHTYEADEDIVADGEERESTINAHLVSSKKTQEIPLENISIPLTVQVKDGKLSVKWKKAHSDKCGQAHTVSMTLGTAEQLRKDRMRLPRADIRITVMMHGQTYTYEADNDVVADGEELETTLGAHLVE